MVAPAREVLEAQGLEDVEEVRAPENLRETEEIQALLDRVTDPELPFLTLRDLGVLRGVQRIGDAVEVTITPTYSGCPALSAMESDIRRVLTERGYRRVRVRTELSPAWSTDDISDAGRQALRDHGIAPPARREGSARAGIAPAPGPTPLALTVRCPQCGSPDTREVARFGSTSCKALWTCRDCLEPFDRFKPL